MQRNKNAKGSNITKAGDRIGGVAWLSRALFLRSLAILSLSIAALLPLEAQAQDPTVGPNGDPLPGATAPIDQADDSDGPRVLVGLTPQRSVVRAPSGAPEFVVMATPAQAHAAVNVLAPLGAHLVRQRNYPNLNRTGLFFRFAGGLLTTTAQAALDEGAPGAAVAFHTYYRFAQGSRIYAPQMVGLSNPQSCRVGGNIRLGLIDGPVDPGHPALAGVRVSRESVLALGEQSVGPAHGTAVAGLMVGQEQSGALEGFASGAQLVAISSFSVVRGQEVADVERIAAALDRMVALNVRLVNMSFAGPPNAAVETILAEAAGRGLVMIAAAGNEGSAAPQWPAASPHVIAVTAIDAAMRPYTRANFGGHIEFAAPGVDVLVASGPGGAYRSGTSYAAPIVTALAARLGGGSLATVRQRLQAAAVDLGSPGRDGQFGWGLVRAQGC